MLTLRYIAHKQECCTKAQHFLYATGNFAPALIIVNSLGSTPSKYIVDHGLQGNDQIRWDKKQE